MQTINLRTQRYAVWELRMAGMPMSEIAKSLHVGAEFVRATICGIWADDRTEAKDVA